MSVPIVRTAKLPGVIKSDVSRKPTSTSAVPIVCSKIKRDEQIKAGARPQLGELDRATLPCRRRASPGPPLSSPVMRADAAAAAWR